MYKVMFVDDDAPMLKYLLNIIRWNELGLEVVATAQSAVMALQIFQDKKPQLVITDIGMPKMDGIELADRLKQLQPDVRIIFLTCHEDFHYAQKAIHLNIDDYIIKDELTVDALKRSVEKAVKLIGALRCSNEILSYRDEVTRNSDLLKQSFWKQIIYSDHSKLALNSGQKHGIVWNDPFFLLGILHIDQSSLIQHYNIKDSYLIYYSVYNIAQELAGNFKGITVFMDVGVDMHIVMNYQRNLALNIHEFFRQFAIELQSKVREYLKIETYLVYSYEVQGTVRIRKTIEELLMYNRELYYDNVSIGMMPQRITLTSFNAFIHQGENIKEKLFQAFYDKDITSLLSIVDKYAEQSAVNKLKPSLFIVQLSQWVRLLEYESGYTKESNTFHSNLENTVRLQETLRFIKIRLREILIAHTSAANREFDNHKLHSIDNYIATHLSENISLVSIASHLYLNPSYFSRYFKKMTGVNFTDYVHRYKMNIALQLIKNKEMTIEMISSNLGYSDRTYFSKVFKKYNGVSPVDYKGKYRKLRI